MILFGSLNIYSQQIFKVIKAEKNYGINKEVGNDSSKYYRIVFLKVSNNNVSYPLVKPNNGFDTLKAIKELLSFEGDSRLCCFPVVNYNPLRSQLYLGLCKYYSIQLEALFIINQLVLKRPFNYSSYPILVNQTTKEEASISGNMVKIAFKAYKEWFKKIKRNNIKMVENETMMPLNNSGLIRWY